MIVLLFDLVESESLKPMTTIPTVKLLESKKTFEDSEKIKEGYQVVE